LNAEAVAILQAWRQFRSRRASAARVFPGSDGEGLQRIDKAWRSLIEIAGIENFRFLAMAVERVARAAEPAPNPPTPQPTGSGADGASPTPP
jgi:hypothetical protein